MNEQIREQLKREERGEYLQLLERRTRQLQLELEETTDLDRVLELGREFVELLEKKKEARRNDE